MPVAIASGRSVVVRYETLHADPRGELRRATTAIQPVTGEQIERAIAALHSREVNGKVVLSM